MEIERVWQLLDLGRVCGMPLGKLHHNDCQLIQTAANSARTPRNWCNLDVVFASWMAAPNSAVTFRPCTCGPVSVTEGDLGQDASRPLWKSVAVLGGKG